MIVKKSAFFAVGTIGTSRSALLFIIFKVRKYRVSRWPCDVVGRILRLKLSNIWPDQLLDRGPLEYSWCC